MTTATSAMQNQNLQTILHVPKIAQMLSAPSTLKSPSRPKALRKALRPFRHLIPSAAGAGT